MAESSSASPNYPSLFVRSFFWNRTDHHLDQPQSTPNESLQSSQEDIMYGDSSWPLYAMYSKIVQEEDNKIAENHQKSADGILIFTGLFSATVAALLAATIPDLKPNPQETSAFYLENIYRLLHNANASDGSIPSTLAKPPASSTPKYVVWVNSLWLLALLISLAGALSATIEQRCALRHITITQNNDYSPERRARIHAVFAKSEFGRFIFRDSNAIILCLHLSLFLFMAGVLIYFFNISHATFYAVVWWITIVTILYILCTVVPIFLSDELLYTPFSSLALRVYLVFPCALSQVLSWIKPLRGLSDDAGKYYRDLRDRYKEGFIEGKTKSAEEEASKLSSTIDREVLEKTLLALNDDQDLEKFFDAIPGFFDSNLVQKPLDSQVGDNLQRTLAGFLDRTFSSHLVTESVKINRLITCLNTTHSVLGLYAVSQILGDLFKGHGDEAPQSVIVRHCLRRWSGSSDDLVDPNVRRIAACVIACAQNRDDQWTMLVKEVFGVPDQVFQDYLAHGDSVLLAILIHTIREALRTGRSERGVLESLSQFDVHKTLPKLQHDFCTLWNEIVQEAEQDRASSIRTQIVAGIHHLFATLHQGTDAAPTRFPTFPGPIDDPDAIPNHPSSYPSCDVSSHLPSSSAQIPLTTCLSIPSHMLPNDSHQVLPSVSQPLLGALPDVATEYATPRNSDISLVTLNPIHSSTPGGGPTPQRVEETSRIPPSAAFHSLATLIPNPAFSSQIPTVLPRFTDSAVIQTAHVPHTPAATSSTSTTAALSASSHVDTVSSLNPGVNNQTASARDDT